MALISEAVHLIRQSWGERSEVARSSQASPEPPCGSPLAAQWGHLGVVQAGPSRSWGPLALNRALAPTLTLQWARKVACVAIASQSCAQPIEGHGDGKQVDPPSLAHPILEQRNSSEQCAMQWLKQAVREASSVLGSEHSLKPEAVLANIGPSMARSHGPHNGTRTRELAKVGLEVGAA